MEGTYGAKQNVLAASADDCAFAVANVGYASSILVVCA